MIIARVPVRLLGLLILYFIPLNSDAQEIDAVYSGQFTPYSYEFDYAEIKGSAYYDEALRLGSIHYRSGEVTNTYLRYNVFEDAIEYLDDTRLLTINNPQDTKYITIGNKELVFSAFRSDKSIQRGYLWKASEGNVLLFARYVIDFSEEELGATGYHRKKPDEFRLKPTIWLIKQGNLIKEISTTKTELSEIFGSEYSVVDNFRKQEKLKMRRDADVVRMFDFFNSL